LVVTPRNVMVGYQFHPEDGGSIELWNVGILPQHYTASLSRRPRLETVRIIGLQTEIWNLDLRNMKSEVMTTEPRCSESVYCRIQVKVKVKLSLCFNWAPHHEGVWEEWRHSSTHSLTSALDGGEWSVSRPGRFIPSERAPGTHWIGGWVGPRAVLDAVVKRKIPSPRRESNPLVGCRNRG
jgi:hypothetical protein